MDKAIEEYIEKLYFQLPDANTKFNFEKVCKRTYLDIAIVNTALCWQVENNVISEANLPAGGIGPVPAFISKASHFLTGKHVSNQLIGEVIAIAQTEIATISDVRGTAAFKRLLLSQLIKAHFVEIRPLS